MIRKYHNHTPQTTTRIDRLNPILGYRDEESQNIYRKKDIRKTLKSKQPALQDDCKTTALPAKSDRDVMFCL